MASLSSFTVISYNAIVYCNEYKCLTLTDGCMVLINKEVYQQEFIVSS